MTDDLIERLRYATKDVVTGQRLNPGVDGHAPIEDLEEAADEIEQLRAQVEALQNKCANRGLSPEDSDALQAEIERLRAVVDAMRGLVEFDLPGGKNVYRAGVRVICKDALSALEDDE